jgi:hypothetical protein
VVGVGHILGLEDVICYSGRQYYFTTVCISDEVEVYKIEKEAFTTLIKQTAIWSVLVEKCTANMKGYRQSIFRMQKSNFGLIESLRSKNKTIEP